MRLYSVLIAWFWMSLNWLTLDTAQPVAITILSLQVVCDLTITASMVYYLYTQCTRVKQWVNLWCIYDYGDDGCLAQDNYYDHDACALLYYQQGSCEVRSPLFLSVVSSEPHRSVFSIACLIAVRFYSNTSIHVLLTASTYQFVRASCTLIYAPFFFSLVHVYVCVFLAMSVHSSPLHFSLTNAIASP